MGKRCKFPHWGFWGKVTEDFGQNANQMEESFLLIASTETTFTDSLKNVL